VRGERRSREAGIERDGWEAGIAQHGLEVGVAWCARSWEATGRWRPSPAPGGSSRGPHQEAAGALGVGTKDGSGRSRPILASSRVLSLSFVLELFVLSSLYCS
jgi:hypothetical protein